MKTKCYNDPSRIDSSMKHICGSWIKFYFVTRGEDKDGPCVKVLSTYTFPYNVKTYNSKQDKDNVIEAWGFFKKDCPFYYKLMEQGSLTICLQHEFKSNVWFDESKFLGQSE